MQKEKLQTIVSILILVIIVLTVVIGCLFSLNKSYKQENRTLMLQNDSVLSVNIVLQDTLNRIQRQTAEQASTFNSNH